MGWLIYGANGYTGRLIAEEAVNRGLKPVLAGRNREDIDSLGARLGLETRVFSLDKPDEVCRGISGMKLVLHCAGPFSQTSSPMVDACLKEGVHYLDITGEISVFSAAHERDEEARRSDVVLLPGAGFDVVPTDCLAAILVEALPAATSLQLAFEAAGGPSPGTAKTSIEGMASGGKVRRDGKLVDVPLGWKTRTVPFAHGERHAVKPGVTGWAQLKYSYGASEEDAIEKLQYDLYYIKNQTTILDIMIILQTVEVVLWGKGAR